MTRHRMIEDGDLLWAARRVLGRVGPARFTLAEVGREAGLAPATLLQRFGSKRGMMLALGRQSAANVRERFEEAKEREGSPLAALMDFLCSRGGIIGKPEDLSSQFAFLEASLGDGEFRRLVVRQARLIRAGVRILLEAAAEAGELARCDTGEVARSVQVAYNGALLTWAILREGKLPDWMRRNIEAALLPHLRATRRK